VSYVAKLRTELDSNGCDSICSVPIEETTRMPMWLGSVFDHILGIIGVLLAFWSFSRIKKTKIALKQKENELLYFIASSEFGAIATIATEATNLMRRREWESVFRIVINLGNSLAMANGAWRHLLTDLEKDKLDVATGYVQSLVQSIPVGKQERQVTDEQIQNMIELCQFVSVVTGPLAGRLKVAHMTARGEE